MTEEMSPQDVRLLARIADLPLDIDNASAVAQTLAAWLPEANRLSAMMSNDSHRELTPITAFRQLSVTDVVE